MRKVYATIIAALFIVTALSSVVSAAASPILGEPLVQPPSNYNTNEPSEEDTSLVDSLTMLGGLLELFNRDGDGNEPSETDGGLLDRLTGGTSINYILDHREGLLDAVMDPDRPTLLERLAERESILERITGGEGILDRIVGDDEADSDLSTSEYGGSTDFLSSIINLIVPSDDLGAIIDALLG